MGAAGHDGETEQTGRAAANGRGGGSGAHAHSHAHARTRTRSLAHTLTSQFPEPLGVHSRSSLGHEDAGFPVHGLPSGRTVCRSVVTRLVQLDAQRRLAAWTEGWVTG